MSARIVFVSESQMVERNSLSGSPRLKLHDEAMRLAAQHRRCELELFEVISLIDERQVYFDLEITSLFQYCTEMLKLSRQVSYDFITVVRKAREVPLLREALVSERTTISKLRKICPVITSSNATEWIELTKECSARVVERAVAMAKPRAAIHERLTYVSAETLRFQLAVSEEWADLLTAVKDLLSQKHQRAVTSEEAIHQVMSEFVSKHDPVAKAERARRRNGFSATSGNKTPSIQSLVGDRAEPSESEHELRRSENEGPRLRSRYVSACEKHAVNLRDKNQCAFVDRHGKRCSQKRWLQKHHVDAFANGGSNAAENLKTLCWAHHAMEHRR